MRPERFKELEIEARALGFLYVASGPLVRSSYKAGEYFATRLIKGRRAVAQTLSKKSTPNHD